MRNVTVDARREIPSSSGVWAHDPAMFRNHNFGIWAYYVPGEDLENKVL